MKTVKLDGLNGGTRNVTKMWNLFVIWKEDPRTEADCQRILRDRDSHAVIELRKNMHERYPYLTAHWAIVRDVVDVALLAAVVAFCLS